MAHAPLDRHAEKLLDQFRRAPGFLRFAPLVIGLADLEVAPESVDFRGLIAGLRALERAEKAGVPTSVDVASAAPLCTKSPSHVPAVPLSRLP